MNTINDHCMYTTIYYVLHTDFGFIAILGYDFYVSSTIQTDDRQYFKQTDYIPLSLLRNRILPLKL